MSNIDALDRIFSLEQKQYKLNNQLIAFKTRIQKKDQQISTLQAEIACLKKQLEKKDREFNAHQNETHPQTVCFFV